MSDEIHILDAHGVDHGDTAMFWEIGELVTPRHGVDLVLSGRRIQISVTRARKKVNVYVDHKKWNPVAKGEEA